MEVLSKIGFSFFVDLSKTVHGFCVWTQAATPSASIPVNWHEGIPGTADFCQKGEKNAYHWQSPSAQVTFSTFGVSK